MSESFNISGESSDITAGPAPQLQSLFIPGIDNSQFIDGFGIVTPWGGGNTARRYADYGIVTDRETQLTDLANSFILAEGGGISLGLEGPQGIQGERGQDGIDGTIHVMELNLPQNTNFLTDLPHNIDSINDLGTAANKIIYTSSYITEKTIGDEDLCSGTTDGDTLGIVDDYWLGGVTDWTERVITLSPAIEIIAGEQYAIIFRALDAPSGDWAYAYGSYPGTFEGGERWIKEGAEEDWEIYDGYAFGEADLRFVYGSNSHTPTPNPALPYSGTFGFSGDYWQAQTFTATTTETLSSITLLLVRGSSGYPIRDHLPGTLTISIRDVTVYYSEATWAEADLTSAGRALLDDATAAAQATTLGLGTGDSPEFTGLTLSGVTAEGTDVDKFLVVT